MIARTVKKPAAKSRNKKLGKRRPIVVQLGNAGFKRDPQAAETIRLAERRPDISVIGIDRKKPNAAKRPGKTSWKGRRNAHKSNKSKIENWHQIQASFGKGLKGLRDNSVSVIQSKMALGHYTLNGREAAKYDSLVKADTTATLNVAHKKLKKGGKLKMILGSQRLELVKDCLNRSRFEKGKIGIRKIPSANYVGTHWMKEYPHDVYRITLTK